MKTNEIVRNNLPSKAGDLIRKKVAMRYLIGGMMWLALAASAGAAGAVAVVSPRDAASKEFMQAQKRLDVEKDPDVLAAQARVRAAGAAFARLEAGRKAFDPAKASAMEDFSRYDALKAEQDRKRKEMKLLDQALVQAREAKIRTTEEGRQALKKYQDCIATLDEQARLQKAAPPAFKSPPMVATTSTAPTKTLSIPAPASVSVRKARFETRNNPAGIAELARDFFALIDPSTPGLEQAVALFKADKPRAALESYKTYFFDKLLYPEKHRLLSQRPPEEDAASVSLASPEVAAAALVGEFMAAGLRGKVGQPGAINWAHVTPDPQAPTNLIWWYSPVNGANLDELKFFMVLNKLDAFDTLLNNYVVTGEGRFLKYWAQVMDDRAANRARDLDACPFNVRYEANLSSQWRHTHLLHLLSCARTRPTFIRDMPAETLARHLMDILDEAWSPSLRINRHNPANWGSEDRGHLIQLGLMLHEFRVAQWGLREGVRLTQLNYVHKLTRDGGNIEPNDEGHEQMEYALLPPIQNLFHFGPEWLTPQVKRNMLEDYARHVAYFMHNKTPEFFESRFAPRARLNEFAQLDKLAALGWDARHQQPELARREKSAIVQLSDRYGAFMLERATLLETIYAGRGGLAAIAAPQTISESLPYIGYYFLRDGWTPGDRYIYFKSMPQVTSQSGEMNNGFYLMEGLYRHITQSPVCIDGRAQDKHDGYVEGCGGKTMFMTYARNEPAQTRFHTSPRFDLAEGVYAGAYRYYSGHYHWEDTGVYAVDQIANALQGVNKRKGIPEDVWNKPVRDVKHTRQVLAVRGQGLYIVTDRMASAGPHEYEIFFHLPVRIGDDFFFDRVRVMAETGCQPIAWDAKSKTVQTANPGAPNLGLHFFGHEPLEFFDDPRGEKKMAPPLVAGMYAKLQELKRQGKDVLRPPVDSRRQPILPETRQCNVRWMAGSGSVLVQLMNILPAPGAVDAAGGALREVTEMNGPDGVSGFHAITRDGTEVWYQAGPNAVNALQAGPLTARAEALLVVRTPGATAPSGVALGCEAMAVDGSSVAFSTPDFEFTLNPRLIPIYRPIAPVVINPERNVFADELTVTLSSRTPGVEVRYTTDGSDPTPSSALYTGPIRLTETTHLRAVALRPGLKEVPWALDGTHATVVSRATFYKEASRPAMAVADGKPGLHYEYFEGFWPHLFAFGDVQPAVAMGTVTNLLDVSMRKTEKEFGVRYNGYIRVSQSGVYTLHAPREFWYPDIANEYELRVYVDGELWDLCTEIHAHGTWSVPLAQGLHSIRVLFVDCRRHPPKPEYMMAFPNQKVVWQGIAPVLEISGPDLVRQAIPAGWLFH